MLEWKNKILLYNAMQTGYANADDSPSFSLMALSAFLKEKGYEVEILFDCYSDEELKKALEDWESYEFHSFQAPWLSKSYQNFVNSISWAALFCEIDTKGIHNPLMKLLFKLIAKDAQWSFKLLSFGFALEFKIVNYLYRRKLVGK